MKNKIVFGAGQIGKTTPQAVKRIYQTLMFFSVVWEMIKGKMHLPATTLADIDGWLAAGIPILYAFCQCFGIQSPGNAASGSDASESGSAETGGKMW